MRIGHGYDVHRLVEKRDLIIGGVKIPHTCGLLGHSDADVLLHAVMDSILVALGQGDIGIHFPDKSEEYLGISSLLLAESVSGIMKSMGADVANIDCTIIAQKPKLSPYIQEMRKNIKATTEEGLGFSGAEEGIAAHAVCLLNLKD